MMRLRQKGEVWRDEAYRGCSPPLSPIASFKSFQPSLATPAALWTVARKLLSSREKSSSAGSSWRRRERPCSVKNKYPARPPITAPTTDATTARELSIALPPRQKNDDDEVVSTSYVPQEDATTERYRSW